MAIFASTTTSGYSDPLRAQSIKALELRLKEQQEQMAAQQSKMFSPENTQTPIQGFGQLANVIGDRVQQGRTEQVAAAQKEELAKLIAADPTGENPQTQARMAVLAPDMYKEVSQQIAARRQQREGFAQADKTQGTRIEADKAAAAEAARVAQVAADAQEGRVQSRPTDLPVVQAERAFKRGEIDKETRDAIVQKATGPSASEMKAGNELQNTHLDTQGALSDLKEARGLLGPDGTGVRAGTGAGWAQMGAKVLGDTLGITDPKLTQPTERYNQLMNAEAITAMAAKLKGASTDYEMKAFVALMNDPNAEPKTKMQALDKMIAKAEAHLALQQEQLKRAKVSAPTGAAAPAGAGAPAPAGAGGGGAATAPAPAATADVPRPAGKTDSQLIAEAEAAKAAGKPAAAVDAQLQKWLMGR